MNKETEFYNGEGLIQFAAISLILILFIILVYWTGENACAKSAVLNHANSWSYNLFGGCYLDGVASNGVSVMDLINK